MILPIGKSVAALEGLANKMEFIARNVVEASTDGLQKQIYITKADDSDQVKKGRSTFQAKAGGAHVEITPGHGNATDGDLIEEFPKMVIGKRYYEANIRYIQYQNELVGTVLHMIG